MLKHVMMIVAAAALAAASNPAAGTAAGSVGGEIPGVAPGKPILDKTWTAGGQEKRGGLASAYRFVTYEPDLFSSGGHGIQTRNPLRGTTFPVWPLAIRLPSGVLPQSPTPLSFGGRSVAIYKRGPRTTPDTHCLRPAAIPGDACG